MKHRVSFVGGLAILLLALASTGPCDSPGALRPRLVVVVVVDQMRADYIERFGPLLRHGIGTTLAEGAVYPNGRVGYAMALTAPGHATISTGDYPKHHGVWNNSWWDRERHRNASATVDETTRIAPVGALDAQESKETPGHSPRMLLRETLGDRLKRASPSSKVFSISIKNRSAVLLGGHRPDGVYWYDHDADGFVTSTYYDDRYPAWLVEFDRTIADADGSDDLSFRLAERIVDAEQLGQDKASDLLWISASQGDHIGHRKGPDSPELREYYEWLDGRVGQLIARLDERVRRDRYVLVLASDHGVRPLAEVLTGRGVDARDLSLEQMVQASAEVVATAARREGLGHEIVSRWVDGVVIDPQDARQVPLDRQAQFRRAVAAELRALDFVADSFTYDELVSTSGPDRPYLEMFRRGFHAGRGPDVVVNFPPNYLCSGSHTSHGTPYDYDQFVPIAFLGSGIPAGRHEEVVNLVDIAPTLAELLRLPAGDGFDGRSLHPGKR